MSFFTERVEPILKANEGGYTNDPRDPGGETNHGWTVAEARRYGFTGRMADMTWAWAAKAYERRYFSEPGFDQVAARMPDLAVKLTDIGVNQGVDRASKYLQRGLNVLNRRGRDYADITVDGDVGPGTLRALDAYKAKRGKLAELALLELVRAYQTVRYCEVAEGNAATEDYMWGWLTRARR
jgi:lysozyme family protein